jgi:hypothetical protein
MLRQTGELTEQTLRNYYGEKRFEQVAESNAIEGSTLSVGETELAVLKGVTITGHDPAYARDAIALDKALNRIAELARQAEPPIGIEQVGRWSIPPGTRKHSRITPHPSKDVGSGDVPNGAMGGLVDR